MGIQWKLFIQSSNFMTLLLRKLEFLRLDNIKLNLFQILCQVKMNQTQPNQFFSPQFHLRSLSSLEQSPLPSSSSPSSWLASMSELSGREMDTFGLEKVSGLLSNSVQMMRSTWRREVEEDLVVEVLAPTAQ